MHGDLLFRMESQSGVTRKVLLKIKKNLTFYVVLETRNNCPS